METGKRFFRKLVLRPETKDLDKFEEFVKAAKDTGFTHICISDLSERTDFRGEDEDSPWCEWSINSPALFKHITPPGLEDAFPADFVKRQISFLRKKHDIVAKYGLKAAYFGNEPHWLSKRVYAKHPSWRGARCDNSLRTVGMFFAPCVDNPEVLEAYRKGVEMIVKEAPLIDTFVFKTNDAGSGLCWSRQLYVNPNGHSDCRFRDMGDRVVRFLKTIRSGAADAGVDAEAFISAWRFPQDEAGNIIAKLEPGVSVVERGAGAKTPGVMRCFMGESFYNGSVCGYWSPLDNITGLFSARNDPAAERLLVMTSTRELLNALRLVMESHGRGTEKDKMDVLRKLAGELYSDDVTDEIVDAWYRIASAQILVSRGSARKTSGGIFHRWLTRPLVPFQDRLTEEEKSYWLPYIYQSKGAQPECYMDYLNSTGRRTIANWSEASTVSILIDNVENILAEAAGLFEQAREKTSDKEAKEKLRLEVIRVKAQRCVYLNARHTIQVAVLGYERDGDIEQHQTSTEPVAPPVPEGSPGLFYMHRAMRWEIDNITELISLLKESPVPLLPAVKDKSQEGAFVFGPDLVEDLEKKVQIMLKHWRDAEDGFYRPLLGG